MPSLPAVLTDIASSPEWEKLAAAVSSGRAPGALLAVISETLSASFRDMYARAALCHSGTGKDDCPSCMSWTSEGHPDMLIAGDGSRPPGVAECVALQSVMSLRPFSAKGRLGVIPFADTISLPAANSLLKIAEEPPEGGHLLFIAEEDNLIPTIRSRVWTVNFTSGETANEAVPPQKPAEWAAWIEKTRKQSLDELAPEAGAWAGYLGGLGEWRASASIRNVIYISQKRHMPVSMVQDALMAILREGVPIGQIFGDLR
jgi:DNA polymerase-3 subunit delta'